MGKSSVLLEQSKCSEKYSYLKQTNQSELEKHRKSDLATPSNFPRNLTLSNALFKKSVKKPKLHYSQNSSQLFSSNKKRFKNNSYIYDYSKSKTCVESKDPRAATFIDETTNKKRQD